jgi:hypothetical protein
MEAGGGGLAIGEGGMKGDGWEMGVCVCDHKGPAAGARRWQAVITTKGPSLLLHHLLLVRPPPPSALRNS